MNEIADNYAWWRDPAIHWSREIEQRRRYMPIYHLQEILLQEYVRRCGPVRVLEFGCGFGRHLRYLRELPGVEVHGFDQSEAMLAEMDWAEPEWRSERIRHGDPLGRLPYEDGSFDVVFTVSVLIHVRPEDIDAVLRELLRVTRWQILHVENPVSGKTVLGSEAHCGCWVHDLAGAYRRLGHEIEVLPRCFELEDVYRVGLDPGRPMPVVEPGFAAKLLALDRAIGGEMRRLREELERGHRALAALEARSKRLEKRNERLAEAVRAGASRQAQLLERAQTAEQARADLLERARHAEQVQEELRARARAAEQAQEELRARARAAEQVQEELRARARAAEQAQEELRARARAAEQTRETLRARARAAEQAKDELQAQLRAAQERHAGLLERTRAAEAGQAAQRERARRAEERLAEEQRARQEASRSASAATARAQAAEQRCAELAAQVQRVAEQLTRLQESCAREVEARLAAQRAAQALEQQKLDLEALLQWYRHELRATLGGGSGSGSGSKGGGDGN